MQNVETTQLLNIAGSIIGILCGLVLWSVRSTVSTVKKDIENIWRAHSKAQSQLDKLQGEHDALCKKHK